MSNIQIISLRMPHDLSHLGFLAVEFFFFFNDTATTEIYTLSLHDALPISLEALPQMGRQQGCQHGATAGGRRSEEHTSELQSRRELVCRLLLEKKKQR